MAITIKKYPIWKDEIYYLQNGAYYIKDRGEVVFSGYAKSKSSSQAGTNVYMQDILKNYLSPDLQVGENAEYFPNSNQSHIFTIDKGSDTLFNTTTWMDWSFDDATRQKMINEGCIVSRPINMHWSVNQVIPITIFCLADESGRWNYEKDTTTSTVSTMIEHIASEGLYTTLTIIPDTDVTNFQLYDYGEELKTPVLYWKSSDKRCGYGALYYINQYGGWDSFLLEHNITEKSDLERQEYSTWTDWLSTDFDYQYVNKSIRYTYSTNTGWLSDAQSKIMYDNLFNSPMIYFQDFNGEEPTRLMPVNFTSTSWTKKEFKNGKHLISYDLEFKTSHIRQR